MPSPTDPSISPQYDLALDVRGTVLSGLSGRLVGVGRDGVVHSVQVRAGRLSYRAVRLSANPMVHHIVGFGGSILAFGDDSPAYELSAELDTVTGVDLAGLGRAVAPFPKQDATTDELHLIARAADHMQAHVVVSAGALTRRSRPIPAMPNRINDLALTRDRIVFVADGTVGITFRDGEARTTWIATGQRAPHPVHAHDDGDNVVLLALTPSLERWTMHAGAGSIQREVLDLTVRHFAHCGNDGVGGSPSVLWSTGDSTIRRHDLATARHSHHDLQPDVPGDFVFVPDTTRGGDADGGWLVAFVHDASGPATEVRVIDAAAIAAPAITTARIPRRIPRDLRCTWIPATPH